MGVMTWQRTDIPDQPERLIETQRLPFESRIIRPYDLRMAYEEHSGLGIIREAGMGDVLMLTPMLRELQRRYPGLEVTVYTSPKNGTLLRGNPDVHAIKTVKDFKDDAHGAYVDLRHYPERNPECRTRSRSRLFGDALGIDLQDTYLQIFLTDDELEDGRQRVADLPRPLIGVAPRATALDRSWKYVDDAMPALKRLGSIVWMSKYQEPEPVGLSLTGNQESPRIWASIIAALDLMIAVDSGPMNITAALRSTFKRPLLLALFGVSSSALRLEGCKAFMALEPRLLECAPCEYRFRPATCKLECREFHTAERVVGYARALLQDGEGLDGLIGPAPA